MNEPRSDKVLNNTFGLGCLKLVEAVYPLVLVPILINLLGLESYGEFVLYFAVTQILVVIINLGLDEYLVPLVSRGDDATNLIIQCFKARLMLWLGLALISLIITKAVETADHLPLFVLCSAYEVFNLYWYFHGTQILSPHVVVSFLAKAASVVLILLLEADSNTISEVALILAISSIIPYSVLFLGVSNKQRIRIKDFFVGGRGFSMAPIKVLATNILLIAKDRASLFILGKYLSFDLVALFDIFQKVLTVLQQPLLVLQNAFFPVISQFSSRRLLMRVLWISTGYSVLCYSLVILLSPFAIAELWPEFEADLLPLFVNSLCIFPYMISLWVAKNILVARGKFTALLLSALCTIGIFSALWLSIISSELELTLLLVCIVNVVVFTCEALLRLAFCVKDRLLSAYV